jgi:hypothetical protein
MKQSYTPQTGKPDDAKAYSVYGAFAGQLNAMVMFLTLTFSRNPTMVSI